MARTLQNSRFSVTVLTFGSMLTTVSIMSTACVISPPIEAERQEPDRPPFLDFFSPAEPLVTADSPDPITLSVRAFDENPHENLFFAWVGEQTFPTEGVAPRELGDELGEGELFYRFDPIEYEFEPCDADLAGEERETIWVYVADARLELRGRNVFLEDEEEGFLTSHSWIIDIAPGACFE